MEKTSRERMFAALAQDFGGLAEEYMYLYGVSRLEFVETARQVANNFVWVDARDDEPEVELDRGESIAGDSEPIIPAGTIAGVNDYLRQQST